MSIQKEKIRQSLLQVEKQVPRQHPVIPPLTDYLSLVREVSWLERWNPETSSPVEHPALRTERVWTDAIEACMQEHNGLNIPEMEDPLYLDRSIVVQSGGRILVHPKTVIRMITEKVEYCLIRNENVKSGQLGPVEIGEGGDTDILIEGGVWSDMKNNGHGRQGFREGKFEEMLGTQGCFVLHNIEHVMVRNVTFRDYSSFGIQIGNCRNFLIDGVTLERTADGAHVEGPAEFGIIRNIKGPLAYDDVVALNAWDWRTSSLTFGSITDILVEDTDVAQGSCAIRLLPGVKLFPDGTSLACEVSRCLLSHVRKCHSFKMYDQPNIRCIHEDYSGDLGHLRDIYFEHMTIPAKDLTDYYDTSKNAVFEICEHAHNLHFEDVKLLYEPGKPFPEYLISIGPKSCIRPIPFQKEGTQEIFNPTAKPVVEQLQLTQISVQAPEDPERFIEPEDPMALVHRQSY